MFRKTFIRPILLITVVAGGMLILAAAWSHRVVKPAADCTDAREEGYNAKSQSEFLIWEVLERAVLTSVQY